MSVPVPSSWRSAPDASAHRALRDPSRLAALRASGLLHGGGDEVLDALTRVVATVLNVPVAAVSLVDDRGQSFAGLHGIDGWAALARGTALSHSFCQYVVIDEAPLVVENARSDDRLHTNPAIEELNIAAYAGVPLITRDGETLGALCAINTSPRVWRPDEIQILRDLATAAVAQIQLRSALRDVGSSHEVLPDDQILLQQELERTLEIDHATGLLSRAGFERLVRAASQTTRNASATRADNSTLLVTLSFTGDDHAVHDVAAAFVHCLGTDAHCARVAPFAFAALVPIRMLVAAPATADYTDPLRTAIASRLISYARPTGELSFRVGVHRIDAGRGESASMMLRDADHVRDDSEWVRVPGHTSPVVSSTAARTALLLDEYPNVLSWIHESLESAGWTVHVAVETDEALAFVTQQRDAGSPIDLVVGDASLRTLDSHSIGLLLRFDDPTLPIAVLCSASDVQSQQDPSIVSIAKPVGPRALVERLATVARSSVDAIGHGDLRRESGA